MAKKKDKPSFLSGPIWAATSAMEGRVTTIAPVPLPVRVMSKQALTDWAGVNAKEVAVAGSVIVSIRFGAVMRREGIPVKWLAFMVFFCGK